MSANIPAAVHVTVIVVSVDSTADVELTILYPVAQVYTATAPIGTVPAVTGTGWAVIVA